MRPAVCTARLGDDARIWRLPLANDSPSRQSDANTLLEYIVEEQQLRDVLRVVAAPADGRGTRAPARQHKFRASQPKCARDSADPRRRVRGAGRGHPFKPQSSSRRCFASRRPTCEVLLVGASLSQSSTIGVFLEGVFFLVLCICGSRGLRGKDQHAPVQSRCHL